MCDGNLEQLVLSVSCVDPHYWTQRSRIAASAFTSWASSWLLVSFSFPGGVLIQARPASSCNYSWDYVEPLLFLFWLLNCTKPVPPYPVYTALGLEPGQAFVTGGQASCPLSSAVCLKFWGCEWLRSPFWLWCTSVVDSPHSCQPLTLSILIFVNLIDEMVSHWFAMSSWQPDYTVVGYWPFAFLFSFPIG